MIHPYAYRTGLIASAIIVVWTLLSYFGGVDLYTNFWIPMAIMIGLIVYFVISLKKIRDFNNGNLPFKSAFVNFIVMASIYIVISSVFNHLLIHVMNPQFGSEVNDVIIEKTITWMEDWNAPEDKIEETLVELENDLEEQRTFGGLFMSMLKTIFGFAIVGLIVAAIMKRNKVETLETLD